MSPYTVTLHFKEYCVYYSGKFKTSGINCFWIVNSLLVLSHFSTLNNGSKQNIYMHLI